MWGFPGGSDRKEFTCGTEDPDLILGLGRSPEEGNGNPLQYSCCRVLWTEEPAGLQSMGSQRVGHDRVTNTLTFRVPWTLSFPDAETNWPRNVCSINSAQYKIFKVVWSLELTQKIRKREEGKMNFW